MSKVNMEYTYIGKRTVTGSTVTFTDKTILGRGGIKGDFKFSSATASVWEAGVENDKINRVTGGTCDYETGKLTDEGFAYILGHEIEEETNVVVCKDTDVAPEVGMCTIVTLYDNGVYSYRGLFFPRMKFKVPDETYNTHTGDINLSTYSLSSDIMLDNDGKYREFKTFTEKEDAKAWCDSKFTAGE